MTCSQTGLSDPLRFALIVTRAQRRHGWSSPAHGGSCRPSRLGSGSVAEVIEAAAADGAHRWAGTTTAVFRWANWCRRRPTCQESPKVVHDAPRVVGTVARPTSSVLTFHSCAATAVS